jgi:hypothetical protein
MIDGDKEKKDNVPEVPEDDYEHTKEYYDRDRNRVWKNLK